MVSRHSVFARLLDRSGFDASRVRYEVVGHVTHGSIGAAPDCEAADGVVALLADEALGWAVPGHAGWIQPDWISAWSAAPGALTVDYLPPPTVVHYHDPDDLKVRFSDPVRLRLRADETGLAELVRLAGAILPEPDH